MSLSKSLYLLLLFDKNMKKLETFYHGDRKQLSKLKNFVWLKLDS